jgi:hypothetical protein
MIRFLIEEMSPKLLHCIHACLFFSTPVGKQIYSYSLCRPRSILLLLQHFAADTLTRDIRMLRATIHAILAVVTSPAADVLARTASQRNALACTHSPQPFPALFELLLQVLVNDQLGSDVGYDFRIVFACAVALFRLLALVNLIAEEQSEFLNESDICHLWLRGILGRLDVVRRKSNKADETI